MMAAAMADGVTPITIDAESWAGRNNIATPYSKLESDMLKHAYLATGAEWQDALHPNQHEESL